MAPNDFFLHLIFGDEPSIAAKLVFDLAVVAAFVAYLPVVPLVTRAARVVWMHLDRHFDPD